jgi:hypothetical protein
MTSITFELPDALAEQAKKFNLFTSERVTQWLAFERRQQAAIDLRQAMKQLHALPGVPMSAEQVSSAFNC